MMIAVILYFELLIVGLVYGVVVCIKDARRRGQSPWLVCLLGVFLFPIGTIAWLAFRPERIDGCGKSGSFSLDDHRVQ